MGAEQLQLSRPLLEHSLSRRALVRGSVNLLATAALGHGMYSMGQAADEQKSINQALEVAHEMEQQTPAALGQVELIQEQVAPEQASVTDQSWNATGEMVVAGIVFEAQHFWDEIKKGIKKEQGLD